MRHTLAFTLSLILSTHSYAHDHAKPDLNGWYGSLMMPSMNGMSRISCCSEKDCHETEAEIRNGKWWARLGAIQSDGSWDLLDYVEIPDEKVLKNTPNPTGNPVICHSMAWVGKQFAKDSVSIFCFVASDLT